MPRRGRAPLAHSSSCQTPRAIKEESHRGLPQEAKTGIPAGRAWEGYTRRGMIRAFAEVTSPLPLSQRSRLTAERVGVAVMHHAVCRAMGPSATSLVRKPRVTRRTLVTLGETACTRGRSRSPGGEPVYAKSHRYLAGGGRRRKQ